MDEVDQATDERGQSWCHFYHSRYVLVAGGVCTLLIRVLITPVRTSK